MQGISSILKPYYRANFADKKERKERIQRKKEEKNAVFLNQISRVACMDLGK